ncbi:MAG: amidohydrolase family protein [Xanthobacteraceae bacterium]|nr:amidohydrolase family protein [Xanthobacteraceae bacterium]
MRRRFCVSLFCALLALSAPAMAEAPYDGPIFDAHLHYNWEPKPHYNLEEVFALLKRNNVKGILATSRPNTGTVALMEAKQNEVWVVPFIRQYKTRADIPTWFKDDTIFEMTQDEFKRGYYRGVGEFHIYGKAAATEGAAKLVRFAVEHDLYIHAHCDVEALELLYSHDKRARIIWAHTGFSTPAAEVKALLAKYPSLMGELSYRGGITQSDGKLTDDWRELFVRHSDRFLLGSDTWITPRWLQYDALMTNYRTWLGQLPKEHAQRIAFGNAERLFRSEKK